MNLSPYTPTGSAIRSWHLFLPGITMKSDFDPYEAAFSGDTEGLEHFLFHNPDSIDTKDEDGDTLLHMACWGKQIGNIGILLANKPDVNAIGCLGRTPLHYD